MNLPPSVTPGRVLRWYLVGTISAILLTIGLFFIAGTWPRAQPLLFATLISASLILGYIAWRMASSSRR